MFCSQMSDLFMLSVFSFLCVCIISDCDSYMKKIALNHLVIFNFTDRFSFFFSLSFQNYFYLQSIIAANIENLNGTNNNRNIYARDLEQKISRNQVNEWMNEWEIKKSSEKLFFYHNCHLFKVKCDVNRTKNWLQYKISGFRQ